MSAGTRVTLEAIGAELLVHEGAGEDLVGRRARERVAEPHEPRLPLGAEVGLRVEPLGEVHGVEFGTVPQHNGHHDLITRVRVGYAVDRGQQDVGVTADDGFDRSGGKVLAVHPEPIGRTPCEEDPSVVVDVPEVTAPVPAVTRGRTHGLFVPVVALEGPDAKGVDDLADTPVGVDQASIGVELRSWRLLARLVRHDDPLTESPDGAAGAVARPVESDGTLRRAEDVDNPHSEAFGGRFDHMTASPRCRRRPAPCCPHRQGVPASPADRSRACRCS